MTAPERLLGSPARHWSTLHADLTRLRREYELDDESANSASLQTKLISFNRILLLDAILDHISYAVADEKAQWDRADRDLQQVKDSGLD